jgi:transglutaminase-like putative cysteine protease
LKSETNPLNLPANDHPPYIPDWMHAIHIQPEGCVWVGRGRRNSQRSPLRHTGQIGWILRLAFFLLLVSWLAGCQLNNLPRSEAVSEPAGFSNPAPDPLDNPRITHTGSQTYRVEESFVVFNQGPGTPAKQNVWLALIQDIPPYQSVKSMEISPKGFQLVTDEYGNRYAEFDFSEQPAYSQIVIQASYEVSLNAVEYDLGDCLGDLPDFYTGPELHIESGNPQIQELARQLSAGLTTPCEKVSAFYHYVGDHLVYSYNAANWGAQAALGTMGSDCTEYSDLLIALSRSAGIPARYLEGVYLSPSDQEQLARTEHAWVEVYLPGLGWTPMDPTLGRAALLRPDYFAKMPANHIIVTRGRNPSTLRGASYWNHIYWPGPSTKITTEDFGWKFSPLP